MKSIFAFILTCLGWKIKGHYVHSKKSVMAVIPHTSYWDGVIGYIAMRSMGINFAVLSAEWLFFWPFKYIMKYVLHAFPVGKRSGNAIAKSLKILKEHDKINLVICPEGQLAATDKWNPGFFIIAKRANVPIDVVVFDYHHKYIYITTYDITKMDKDLMLAWMCRDAKEHACAKHKDKFLLHKFN